MKIMKIYVQAFLMICFFSVGIKAQNKDFENHSFRKADSVAALYPNYSLKDLKSLSDKLTIPFSTEPEKFRAIYKWVCDNIENDYEFYLKNKIKRERLNGKPEALAQWNQRQNPRLFQKLLHEHKTICTGYAYLMKELAYHAGITCKIIDGYGRTAQANIGGIGIANHSWNAVQLNNKWFLCDATWSSGIIDMQQEKFIKKFNEAYFLTEPFLFIRNHYPLDSAWILSDDRVTLQEFLTRPLIYKEAISHSIIPIFPETFDVTVMKGESLKLSFTSNSDQLVENMVLQVLMESSTVNFHPEVYIDETGLQSIDHKFRRKGNCLVHVMHQGDYLFSYRVKVKTKS